MDADSPNRIVGCFLCDPPNELTYSRNATGQAISGLGPLVDGYSVVAALPHVRSAADAAAGAAPEFLGFAESIRTQLVETYGSCLMTEHGRMPVCADVISGERHCYHAHFLLFPGGPDVMGAAQGYFNEALETEDLLGALRFASRFEEYFLLSPTPQRYAVFANSQRLPRQFARTLVAAALGKTGDAAWQAFPNRAQAIESAAKLRYLFSRAANA